LKYKTLILVQLKAEKWKIFCSKQALQVGFAGTLTQLKNN